MFLWADLGNQTVVIVQPSVWTGHVERRAAIIVTIHSILYSCWSQSGCSCSLFLSLRLSSVSRILLQVLPVPVWHSCSLTMRDETREQSCRLCCSDILHAVTLLLQKALYTGESWMTVLWKYWFTKAVFKCPEKATIKLEVKREAWQCAWQAHSGRKGPWPCLAPGRLAPKLGFSSCVSQGSGGIPHMSITVI